VRSRYAVHAFANLFLWLLFRTVLVSWIHPPDHPVLSSEIQFLGSDRSIFVEFIVSSRQLLHHICPGTFDCHANLERGQNVVSVQTRFLCWMFVGVRRNVWSLEASDSIFVFRK
jgi:hypothetical protein